MAETAPYGGTVTLNPGGGAVTMPCKVAVNRTTGGRVDRTVLSDYAEKAGPGRIGVASGTFTVRAGTEAATIRTHMNPGSLSAAVARTLTLVWTDQLAVTFTKTVCIEDVSETHDGQEALLECAWFEVA